jgi:hypothetical protein
MSGFDDFLNSLVQQSPPQPSPEGDPAAAADFLDSVTSGRYAAPPMTTAPPQNMTPMPAEASDDGLRDIAGSGTPPVQSPSLASPPNAAPKAPADEVADFVAYRQLLNGDQGKLDRARAATADRDRTLNLAQAAGDFGAGMAGVKVDPAYYNAAHEQNAATVKGAEGDVERNRKLVQDFMNNKRAEAVAKENREARLQASHDAAAMRNMVFQQGMEEKAAKRFTTFGDALDPDKNRAGNFGTQQQIVYNAKKIQQLAAQFPDLNLPPAQVAELAQATAGMLSNGNHAAESTVDRYVPKSVGRSAAELQQWITNKPQGAEQQAFVKQMLDTAARERQLAESNVKDIKFKRVAQFSDLQKKDPATFNAILESHEVDPDEYATYQSNGFKMPKASAPGSGAGNDALESEMRKRGLLK